MFKLILIKLMFIDMFQEANVFMVLVNNPAVD